MILDDVLAHNRAFTSRSGGAVRSPMPAKRACVVTCMDARLVDFLSRALGVGRGEVDWVATAGNTITPHDNAILRSVTASVILYGVREVLVIGHTDCGMACDVLPFTEAMEAAGVTRGEVGPVDLREFFGFIPSPETNVRQVVDALRASPVIPPAVVIHGLMVDVETGALRVVVRGEPAGPRQAWSPVASQGGGGPLPPLGAGGLSEVDVEAPRVPQVHVAESAGAPVAITLSPAKPVAAAQRGPVEVVPAAPPGRPSEAEPAIIIDVSPAGKSAATERQALEAAVKARRARRRPAARPTGGAKEIDISLGPVRRHAPRRP